MSGSGHKYSSAHSLLVESTDLIHPVRFDCIVPMGQSLSSPACNVCSPCGRNALDTEYELHFKNMVAIFLAIGLGEKMSPLTLGIRDKAQ
eukprot:14612921-Ditylum_brightwellii.AAC.1